MPLYTLTINASKHEVNVDSDTPVLWVLRDHLNLLGTKYGCGIGQCGACTIHLNGNAVRSCSLPVSAVANANMKLTTIEGLSKTGEHPVQKAWLNVDVAQCGYCQAGQIMSAVALLNRTKSPSSEEISNAMSGNLCRCGTYTRINKAVTEAAKDM